MNNNDIFKKLRVALQLRDDQIIEFVSWLILECQKEKLEIYLEQKIMPILCHAVIKF